MPKEIRLTIWIVLLVFVVAAFLFWIFYPKIKKAQIRKNPKKYFYRKVMKVAKYGDYYLINNMKIHPEEDSSPSIDHMLVGNKYFYLIYDYYFEGAVDASLNDEHWIYHKMDGSKAKINNPLNKATEISDYFSLANSIDSSYIVTIVLINDDCFITPIKNTGNRHDLVALSKLEKLISTYEASKVGSFKANDLENIVKHFAEKKNNATDKR